MLFDDAAAGNQGGLLLFAEPESWIEARTANEVYAALNGIDAALAAGMHVAGYFAYELGFDLDRSLSRRTPRSTRLPLLRVALFRETQRLSAEAAASFLSRAIQQRPAGRLFRVRSRLWRDVYLSRFAQVAEFIHAGDIYQLNLAIPFEVAWEGDPLALYARLRDMQPVRHGGYIAFADGAILSFSPELFFELSGGMIRTRPMKGTQRRGATPAEDVALRQALQHDEKNRAENLMIVDLMRNDLSRICMTGSVRVGDLHTVESLPTLFQMTSGIEGRLQAGTQFSAILRALFPAGSITGAPKHRAIEIIQSLERRPRGVYTGAMGYVRRGADGRLAGRFNVAIRTLTLYPDGSGETFAGSGIVADSTGPDEYDECLLKVSFLMPPDYELIETVALTPAGELVLFERHLERLRRSAAALGFACPLDDIEASLRRTAAERPEGHHRLRVELSASGGVSMCAERWQPPSPDDVVPLAVSDKRVDSSDRLLQHKTTRRRLYESEWSRWHEVKGAGEVLFLNERGEVTEGSRSNVFIERRCELLTPPLACGLLPGTLREEMIESGKAREQVLTRADLEGAEAVYVGNSLRGLQRGRLLR